MRISKPSVSNAQEFNTETSSQEKVELNSKDLFSDEYQQQPPRPSKTKRRIELNSNGLPCSTGRPEPGEALQSIFGRRRSTVAAKTETSQQVRTPDIPKLAAQFAHYVKEEKLSEAFGVVKKLLPSEQGKAATWQLAQAYIQRDDIGQALNLLEAADCELTDGPTAKAFCEAWDQKNTDPFYVAMMVQGLEPRVRNAVAKSFHEIYLEDNKKEPAFWMASYIVDEKVREDALLACAAKWSETKLN